MMLTLINEKKVSGGLERNAASQAEELLAFCPGCKALQTVWLNGNTLMPTRKFTQVGSQIYHNCSSKEPCRLYYSS
ncbi:MAG: hypothetical protein ABR954_09980 [Dehalococcoidales bacterium]|jgi:hypothetical protein